MGLRIKEYENRRKLEAKRYRRELLNSEAMRFKRFAWSNNHADKDFLEKLNNIKDLIKSEASAYQIAEDLDKLIHEDFKPKKIHSKLITSVILELL